MKPRDKAAKGRGQAAATAVSCALFYCFSFIFLYFFQADLLATSQHILSEGATTYSPLIGAVLITIVLALLQAGVARLTRLRGWAFALTFVPSSIVLALLGGMTPMSPDIVSNTLGLWPCIAILVLWGGACWVIQRIQAFGLRPETGLFFTSTMWRNVLLLAAQFLFVGLAGNSDATLHHRLRAEACLMRGDIDGALAAGRNSEETDAALTMLRAYALALQGRMGDNLFKYPVAGTADDIVPMKGRSECLLLPADSIYRTLGARPQTPMSAEKYFSALRRDSLDTPLLADYELCAALIDRRLDDFASKLPLYYDVNDSLPLHYREALTLYTHLRATPSIVYHDKVMDTDYDDLRKLERSLPTPEARKNAVRQHYAGTYWWYYEYCD